LSRLCLIVSLFLATTIPFSIGQAFDSEMNAEEHAQLIDDWRGRRDAALRREDGWLTLVGLHWLKPGPNRIGSDTHNDVIMPGGPPKWGVVNLGGEQLNFIPDSNAELRLLQGDDVITTLQESQPTRVELLTDDAEFPTIVNHGPISFLIIHRQAFAVRVLNSQASARVNFPGVENFQTQREWRINSRFTPAKPGETLEIANVLGQLNEMAVAGYIAFEKGGKTHRLMALGDEESENLWIIFADRTSGRETYGAGRYLYSDGLPLEGRLVIDFNKAYNPPCAFNEFSTCPLPPQDNRLDLAVAAGEKTFHP